jgi:hypothetical protein
MSALWSLAALHSYSSSTAAAERIAVGSREYSTVKTRTVAFPKSARSNGSARLDSVHFHSKTCPVRSLDEVIEFHHYLLNPHLQIVKELVVLSRRWRIGLLYQRK